MNHQSLQKKNRNLVKDYQNKDTIEYHEVYQSSQLNSNNTKIEGKSKSFMR